MLNRPDSLTGVVVLLVIVGVLAGGLGLWGAWQAVRDQPVKGFQIPGMALVELGLLVQTVVIAAWLGQGRGEGDPALLWGYLITELVLVPVAFGWAFMERTRWSSVVLAVVGLAVVVLQVRVWQIWQGQG